MRLTSGKKILTTAANQVVLQLHQEYTQESAVHYKVSQMYIFILNQEK
jgi:hypothetical protein